MKDLLDSIGILRTGQLPPLVSSQILTNVETHVNALVYQSHTHYVLQISTSYGHCNTKLDNFGVSTDGSMIVAFLNFAKYHTSTPKNWYANEAVKPLSLTMIKLIMINSLYLSHRDMFNICITMNFASSQCMSVFGISQADLSPTQLLI